MPPKIAIVVLFQNRIMMRRCSNSVPRGTLLQKCAKTDTNRDMFHAKHIRVIGPHAVETSLVFHVKHFSRFCTETWH